MNVQVGDLVFIDTRGTGIHHATIISDVTDNDILLAGNTSNWLDESLTDLLRRRPYIQVHIVRLNDSVFGSCNC